MKNIAVLGLGTHAIKTAIPAILKSDTLNLVGVCTRNAQKGEAFAKENSIKYWNDESALLQDCSVDIVYVSTPVGVHYQQVRNALLAGKHVFCEKSLVENLTQCSDLFQIANDANLVLAECFMYFYHSQFKCFYEKVQTGMIGDLKTIRARFGYPHLDKDNIRYDRSLGGGALLDAGVYPISLFAELSKGNIEQFHGMLERCSDFNVDIGGSFYGTSGNVSFYGDWGMGRDYTNELEAWGSEGKIKVERAFSKPASLATQVTVVKNGVTEIIEIQADDHFLNMFNFFVSLIRNVKESHNVRARSLFVAQLVDKLKENEFK